jgi:O-antigen ligase
MLGIAFYLYRSRLVRYWPLLAVLLVAVHLVAPGAIGGLYKSFFPEEGLVASVTGREGQLGSGRLSDVGPAQELWTEKPLLGHGPGTEIVIDDPLVVSLGQLPPEIFFDNQYLNALVTLGAIGLLATAWFVWGAAIKTVRAARRATGREASLLAACGLAASGFAFGMVFFDAFAFVQATLFFVAVAALGLRVAARAAIPADEHKSREPPREEGVALPTTGAAG